MNEEKKRPETPETPKKKNAISLGKIFYHNTFVLAFSFVVAVVTWFLMYANSAERKEPESDGAEATRPEPDAGAEAMFLEFSQKFETLSRAERSVFNLYVQGYDAKEITQLLCLSINTIKTHNKRIYWKLGVNSRRELMGYLRKMREKGFDVHVE